MAKGRCRVDRVPVPAAFAGSYVIDQVASKGLEDDVKQILGVVLLIAAAAMLVKVVVQARRGASPTEMMDQRLVRPVPTVIIGVIGGFLVGVGDECYVIPSEAICIILVTVIVRGIMFPLSRKQAATMARTQEQMAKLQPEIKKVKEKHKGDVLAQQQAMSELYRRHGVNPAAGLGGCLMLFAQMPVFLGLYFIASTGWGVAERKLLPKKKPADAAGANGQPGAAGKAGPGTRGKGKAKPEAPPSKLREWWEKLLKEASKK